MSEPDRYGQTDRQATDPAQSPTGQYPAYPDPAYAGQVPTYGPAYPPAYAPPGGYAPPAPPGQPPVTGAGPQPPEPPEPPEPPGSPRWLWLLAGAAVLLVVGLVVALVVINGSTDKSATISPIPETPTTRAGTPPRAPPTVPREPGTVPTVPPPPGPSPTVTGPPGTTAPQQTDSVVYHVTGDGRAISIIYIDTDAVVQTEFNVPLPWSKEVSLPSSASNMASLTVANIGPEVTCSVTVNGTQVSERTGSVLTVCTPVR